MISTSLNLTAPLGMIGASPNENQKRVGMISTSPIEIGPPGKIGAWP